MADGTGGPTGEPLAPRVVPTSRLKVGAYLAISLLFVSIGALPPGEAGRSVELLAALGFFGLCAVVFAWLLLRPHRLVLDAEGFAVTGGFPWARRRVAWRDVARFFPWGSGRGGRMVGYEFVEAARPKTWIVAVNRGLGADATLPGPLRGSIDDLVDELNARRAHAVGAEAAAKAKP
jgi:hypothetical protein